MLDRGPRSASLLAKEIRQRLNTADTHRLVARLQVLEIARSRCCAAARAICFEKSWPEVSEGIVSSL